MTFGTTTPCPIANLELVAIAQLRGRQVRLGIGQNTFLDLGAGNGELAFAGELHRQFVSVCHHVVVGQDVALGIHDYASAKAVLLERAPLPTR